MNNKIKRNAPYSYSIVNHRARKLLDLNLYEYCVAEIIYTLSNNPSNKNTGWCQASMAFIADCLGLNRQNIYKIIERLIDLGLVERNNEIEQVRTTSLWYDSVLLAKQLDETLSLGATNDETLSLGATNNETKSVAPSDKEDKMSLFEKQPLISNLDIPTKEYVNNNTTTPTELTTTPTSNTFVDFVKLFDQIWRQYPNKDGRKAAERHFKASVKNNKDWVDIQNALANYLNSKVVRDGFIKNGSTWFNNWRDWIVNPVAEEIPGERLKALLEKERIKKESENVQ